MIPVFRLVDGPSTPEAAELPGFASASPEVSSPVGIAQTGRGPLHLFAWNEVTNSVSYAEWPKTDGIPTKATLLDKNLNDLWTTPMNRN